MKIKSLLLLILPAILFSACSKESKNGSIKGKLDHFEKDYVYLQRITDNGEETLDSAKLSKDGSFELKNPATDPDFYILRADSFNMIFLVLRAGEKVELAGNAQQLEASYSVKGSKDSELLKSLRSFDKHLSDSLNMIYSEIRNTKPAIADSVGMQLQGHYTLMMEDFSKKFIENNLTSLVSLSATKFLNQQAEIELFKKLEKSLSSLLPKNKYVIDYKALVDQLSQLPPGSLAPEISLNSPDGKNIKLSSLRGKVVLIDFWASWCGPCRRENPAIVKAYNNLKGSNFEIYGVSLDNNVAAWKQAIEQDKITWIQVSDLKRWDSEVAREYQIEAIPTNVLIDQEGRIIAKGIRGEDLEMKVKEWLAKK